MSSTTVLKNGTVITFDTDKQSIKILPQASVLINRDEIEAIEEHYDSLVIPPNSHIVDVSGMIVSPGFINTHVHMWQTAYRTVGPDVTLTHYFDWVAQGSTVAHQAFTPEDIYISTLEGYLEGLNAGVTSFVDHAHNNWSAEVMKKGFDAVNDSGARVWWCYEPMKTGKEFEVDEQWKVFSQLAGQVKAQSVEMGLGYGGLGGSAGPQFEVVKEMVRNLRIKTITTHHLGGPWPAHHSAPTSMVEQSLHSLDVPIIISHAPYLSTDEIQACRDHNIHISITPESEFHYGHGQTTGHLILDQASLGVDTNWTFSGDILTQARIWLQKVRDTGFQKHLLDTGTLPRNTPFTAEQGFLLATRQGGKALRRDDIGILRPGAKADIVVFNGDSPNMLGWTDPVAAIMLHANVGDVRHVLVDGQWRKSDFKLVNMNHDWSEVKSKFVDAAKRIQKTAAKMKPPVAEKLWGMRDTGAVEQWSTIRTA